MESFIGYIKTPQDALIIFEACRRGSLNRVQRRLTSKERMEIHSGSVFAFDEREAGMRRWTDGRTWSPSRVLGSFLTYRELDTKRRPRRPASSSSSTLSGGGKQVTFSYKHNGLIKQSFSICTATNQKIHLISYCAKSDVMSGRLQRPSNNPMFNLIEIPKGLYPELNPLDVGGGHSASMNSIAPLQQQYNTTSSRQNSIDSSMSSSPSLSSTALSSPQTSEDDFYDNNLLSPLTVWNPTKSEPSIHLTTLLLPIQDIAWEKLPCSEDNRQLNVLRNQVRI